MNKTRQHTIPCLIKCSGVRFVGIAYKNFKGPVCACTVRGRITRLHKTCKLDHFAGVPKFTRFCTFM